MGESSLGVGGEGHSLVRKFDHVLIQLHLLGQISQLGSASGDSTPAGGDLGMRPAQFHSIPLLVGSLRGLWAAGGGWLGMEAIKLIHLCSVSSIGKEIHGT